MVQPGDRAVRGVAPPGKPGRRNTPIATVAGLTILLTVVLVGLDLVALRMRNPAQALSGHYYMALGDSLSFGYQPNLDFSSGFADDLYNDLHPANVSGIVNYACAGETTDTMINGGCIAQFAHHGSYTGAQLQAAIDFLSNPLHRGRVSPITLEIGSNDVIPSFDTATCTVAASADDALARMDANLTQVILPRLLQALGTPTNAFAGDLHLLNYYNPFAKACPNSATFAHRLNDHLQADAAQFRISVVDVYNKFGGDTATTSHICDYTWICDARFHDFHPTNLGYRKIADAVESALGLPGTNPLLGFRPSLVALAPDKYTVAFRRGAVPRLAT